LTITGGADTAPRPAEPVTRLEVAPSSSSTRRALVFETLTVCGVTLLPPLTVSTLAAAAPSLVPPVGLAGLVLGVLQALLGLLLVRYVLFARGEAPADIGFRLRLRAVLEAFPLVVVGYVVVVLTALTLLGSVLADVPTQRARTAFLATSASLSLVYVIVGPLFEETVVRAYLMTRLTTLGFAVPTVVLASAVLQTAYHTYQGFAFALVYLPLFVVFAVYFAWRRNAVAPALAHVLVDVVSWTALHGGLTGR
jgi:membrane protease YdiL (CAAX protease family)